MSVVNIFEHNLETNMMSLINSHLESLSTTAHIVRGETGDTQILPLIIVHAVDSLEAVFQSGIYQVKLTVTVKEDLDSGSPAHSSQLFGAVVDVLQQTDIITLMNNLGGLYLKGSVLLDQSLEEVGDRMWVKSVSVDFFGFSVQ